MDIVSLSPARRQQKKRVRRHTTELRLADFPTSNVTEKNVCSSEEVTSSSEDKLTESELLNICWDDSYDVEATGSSAHNEGSQIGVLQEMKLYPREAEMPKHGYQLSYELALDNMLTPFVRGYANTSYVDHVIMEIVSTEETYVGDLTDIIEGYISPLEGQIELLQIDMVDINSVFGNIREIKEFNRSVLNSLKDCCWKSKEVGQCFIDKAEGFKSHYSHFCNNYPNSIRVLSKLQADSSISQFIKMCQQHLNHMLPLEAYLLKPVQRVMKYSLLLRQLMKNMCVDDHGVAEVSCAVDIMTSVSEHINKMKEEYDADVHIRGLQNLIKGFEGVVDLTKAGELVLEDNLRYGGGRTTVPSLSSRADRHVYTFLFRRLLLLTKKDDNGYLYKTHLEIKDIQLTERVEKETNSFQIRQISTANFYNLQARTQKRKEKWVNAIKKLLMESIPGLPDKTRMLIMTGFPLDSKRSPKSPHRQRHISELRQTRTSSNHSRAKQHRSSTSPSLLTSQLVQASLVATLQLQPYQEKGEEEFCQEQTESHVARSEPSSKDDKVCHPFTNTHYSSSLAVESGTVKQDSKPQKDDDVTNDNDLDVQGTNSEQLSDVPYFNQGDMQTLQVILCGSQESVTETETELVPTPQLAPPLEFSTTKAELTQQTNLDDPTRSGEYMNKCKSARSHTFNGQPEIYNAQGSINKQEPERPIRTCHTFMMPMPWSIDEKLHTVCLNSPRMQRSSPYLGDRESVPTKIQAAQNIMQPIVNKPNPYTGNPDEELYFDEVLQHYDNFATSTGKTAKSSHVSQPLGSPNFQKRERRKKDRKRSMTVASVDRADGKLSHLPSESPKTPFSKVQNLAREYSRRIKDHQRSKHFSTVTDEVSSLDNNLSMEQLVHNSSTERVTPAVEDLTSIDSKSTSSLYQKQTSMTHRFHTPPADLQETQSNRSLKGLVKSLVVKFGGGK